MCLLALSYGPNLQIVVHLRVCERELHTYLQAVTDIKQRFQGSPLVNLFLKVLN